MRVGFIGLGIMGKPMAKNLIKAGYDHSCVRPEREAAAEVAAAGATVAGSIAGIAASARSF